MRELTQDETRAVSGGGLFSFVVGTFVLTFSVINPIDTIKAVFRTIFGSGGGASEPVATTNHNSISVSDFDRNGDGFLNSDEHYRYSQAVNYDPHAQIP
jgi:hypothetical protein